MTQDILSLTHLDPYIVILTMNSFQWSFIHLNHTQRQLLVGSMIQQKSKLVPQIQMSGAMG